MQIIVPLQSPKEVAPLINAGATEFYAGLFTDKTFFGARPHKKCNFCDWSHFKEAVLESKKNNVDVALCFNAVCGREKENKALILAEKVMSLGIRKFILFDMGLFLEMRKRFSENKYIISTVAGCFNSETVKFYQDLGASRVILPRELSLKEADFLAKDNPKIELELLILNITCDYMNSFCRMHNLFVANPFERLLMGAGLKRFYLSEDSSFSECKVRYELEKGERGMPSGNEENICFGNISMKCGACAIPYLNKTRLHGLKIVGRGFPLEKKIKDVKFIRSVVDMSIYRNNDVDYSQIRSIYEQCYGEKCDPAKKCHYPYLLDG